MDITYQQVISFIHLTCTNEQLPLNAARFEGVSKRKPKLPF